MSGIPQSSILGPVLFTIFINDLPDNLESNCKVFADDTKIYGNSENHDKLQEDLDKLQKWSQEWNLYFNVQKCKTLHIGKKNPNTPYSMMVNDQHNPIPECSEEKDLGVLFDKDLTFDIHIQKAINKANQMISIIRKCFIHIDKNIFIKLYKALVRPHLEYGNIIWFPFLKRQSIALEKVQRRATKLIKECNEMSYMDRLKYLNLHSLKGRRIRGDLIEIYKIHNNLTDIDFNKLFSTCSSDRTRNNEGKLFIQYSRTNIRKYSFANRVAPHWNSLPRSVKFAPNLNTFKNLLDSNTNFNTQLFDYDE